MKALSAMCVRLDVLGLCLLVALAATCANGLKPLPDGAAGHPVVPDAGTSRSGGSTARPPDAPVATGGMGGTVATGGSGHAGVGAGGAAGTGGMGGGTSGSDAERAFPARGGLQRRAIHCSEIGSGQFPTSHCQYYYFRQIISRSFGRRGSAPLPTANIHPFPTDRAIAENRDNGWCAARYADEH